MFQALLFALLTVLISQPAEQSGTSDIEVIEVFRAETAEELETALADGYPMPWLEEILNDETIPEEDRYWLDCRVRAVIAQDLHLFFDEEGNPVHIEADWIRYGERYWQEHFIVNPLGEQTREEINPETGLWGETGFVYNRYGERTGDLALCSRLMKLSRDGSIGLLVNRGSELQPEFGSGYLFLIYSDGSYHMHPNELWMYAYTLSQSGDHILVRQGISDSPDPIQLFNREGELLWEQHAIASGGTGVNPVILPNDEYCLIPSSSHNPLTRYLQMLSIDNGREMNVFSPEHTMRISYSQDGNLVFVGEQCVSLTNNGTVWTIPHSIFSDFMLISHTYSQDGNYFAITVQRKGAIDTFFLLYNRSGKLLLEEPLISGQEMFLSPHGTFVLSSSISPLESSIPFMAWQTGGDQ